MGGEWDFNQALTREVSMRAFMRLSAVGLQNDKGKVALSFSGGKKSVAPVDRPLALVGQLFTTIMEIAGWSSEEAAQKDLAELRKHIDSFEVVKTEPQAPNHPGSVAGEQ